MYNSSEQYGTSKSCFSMIPPISYNKQIICINDLMCIVTFCHTADVSVLHFPLDNIKGMLIIIYSQAGSK
jgi:hypothetical protein